MPHARHTLHDLQADYPKPVRLLLSHVFLKSVSALKGECVHGRQLRDATAKLQDEGFVSQTVLYQLAQTKLQAQSAELDKYRKIADTLQREREAILHREQGLHHQARLQHTAVPFREI